MNIALITYEFFPELGGIGQNFTSFCKIFNNKEQNLLVFNKYYKSKNIFNILDRKENKYYKIKDLVTFIKNRKLIYYFFIANWTIIKDNQTPFKYKIRMILYLFLKTDILLKTLKNILMIHPFFKKVNIDIIMGSDCSGNILPLIFILSKLFKTKCLSYGHGNDFLVRSRWSLKTYYLRMLDKIIVSNQKTKNLIKTVNHLRENQIKIIPYGLILNEYEINKSKQEIREAFKIPEEKFILLSVGRHVPRKKFDLVIKSIKIIKEKIPSLNLKYYLIGGGPQTPYLKDLTNKLGLENYVEFLGAFGGLKKNMYLKLSDVFVMSSIALKESIEGFGIVFLEANFYKVPVIGTKTGGISEAIINGKTGFLIEPNNVNELVEKILFLYKNKDLRKKMGKEGYNRVIISFNWEKIYNDYINTFEKILNDY